MRPIGERSMDGALGAAEATGGGARSALTPLPPPTEATAEIVAACLLCGSEDASRLWGSRDRLHALPGEFGLVRCERCGLVRLSPRPRPETIGSYYPIDYFQLFYPPDGATPAPAAGGLAALLRHTVGRHLRATVLDAAGYPETGAKAWHRAISPVVVPWYRRRVFFDYRGFPGWEGGGRALDVGCSIGAFLACLKHAGWEVAGVEFDPEAAAIARAKLDCEVFVGEVQDAGFEPGSFDFVHLRHVVEHMYDPVASVRASARLTRPGGLVYIEVPNADGTGARQCGEYWFGWDSPRHLHLFTPGTLRLLVENAGLEIERMQTFPIRDVYRVEDTFRREEAEGRLLERRFRLRARRAPRAAWLAAVARIRRARDPLSGDVLACWARRP